MTTEELQKLTPEQKRVKIAEARGWEYHPAEIGGVVVNPWRAPGNRGYKPAPPDYLNDLNAMHEAEKMLDTDEQIESYLEKLTDICGGDTPIGKASFTAYFATAAQRANAFLLTIQPQQP